MDPTRDVMKTWDCLSDEIWLKVLGQVDRADQLISFIEIFRQNSEETKRTDVVLTLGRVACDKTLWRKVRFTGRRPSDLRKIKALLGPHTRHLALNGPSYAKGPSTRLHVTEAFFQSLKLRCTHLQTLSLDNCCLDYKTSPFRGGKLPTSLQEIRLWKISLLNKPPAVHFVQDSMFWKHHEKLKNLKFLAVDACPWFNKYDRLAIVQNKKIGIVY